MPSSIKNPTLVMRVKNKCFVCLFNVADRKVESDRDALHFSVLLIIIIFISIPENTIKNKA